MSHCKHDSKLFYACGPVIVAELLSAKLFCVRETTHSLSAVDWLRQWLLFKDEADVDQITTGAPNMRLCTPLCRYHYQVEKKVCIP